MAKPTRVSTVAFRGVEPGPKYAERTREALAGALEQAARAKPALVAFPEFFLQGWTPSADLEKHEKDILIEIPGPEVAKLGEKAKEKGIYIAGAALEHDSNFPKVIFNCAFLIGPSGEVIHKHHKFTPASHFELSTSPFDVFDKYMDLYGRGKSVLDTFFPVPALILSSSEYLQRQVDHVKSFQVERFSYHAHWIVVLAL